MSRRGLLHRLDGMTNVYGGGLAGLAAAIALARRGKRVRLIEPSGHLGGRAISTSSNGFVLNLGPHALFCEGQAYRTLAEWGIAPSGRVPRLGPRSHFVFGGERYPAIRSAKDMLLSPMLTAREKLDAANALRKLRGNAPRDRDVSMAQWLDTEVHTPKVRALVEAYVRVSTYTNEPERLSARAALQQFGMAARSGVLYADGGWQTLVDSLESHALACGVTIEKGARRLDSRPRGSILAVPPREASEMTGLRFERKGCGSASVLPGVTEEGLRPVKMACLDLGLAELPPQAAVFALGVDRPFYLSVHSQWAKMTEEPKAVVHVAKYLGSEGPAKREELEEFADLAMPGWRERVVVDRFLPDMTVSHTSEWIGARRPAVDQGSYSIAGDWVGECGMLADACFASALKAAGAV